MGMRIEYRTIAMLHDLSKIAPSVCVHRDGLAVAHDAAGGVWATATIPSGPPRDVIFGDILSLLEPLVRLGPETAKVTFDDTRCTITSGTLRVVVDVGRAKKSRESHIAGGVPSKGRPIFGAALDASQLLLLQHAIRQMKPPKSCKAAVVGNGTEVALVVARTSVGRRGGLGSFRRDLGSSKVRFAYSLSTRGLLALPPDDYALSIDGVERPMLRMTAITRGVAYHSALSVSTVETRGN